MIIKWPERYSVVMLLHAFIHELKYCTKMTNKQRQQKRFEKEDLNERKKETEDENVANPCDKI